MARFVSHRKAAERIERMKQKTDIVSDNRPAPTECWERSGDAIVDVGNGRTASDFIAALKNQSAAAWLAVKRIVVNPVLNEKSIKAIIREKKFEDDEVFGIFLERMMAKGKLDELREPDKVVSFMQQCVRNQVKSYVSEKAKIRDGRLVLEGEFAKPTKLDTKEQINPIDAVPEDEAVVAARNNRLMEDEKEIVRRCFEEFWRKYPKRAYVVALRNSGLSDHEINEIVAVGTDNYVTKLVQRGHEDLAAQILAKTKNILLPGVSQRYVERQRRCIHV